mmetsp:Transcript_31528/g.62504  ORF Transcript_31528/g.62504 Transcript_31528/m.62504 type:complete len:125 (-) Transcript_31528:204-578(-)
MIGFAFAFYVLYRGKADYDGIQHRSPFLSLFSSYALLLGGLQSLSLGQYRTAFLDAAVDGAFLYDLNDDDLKNTLGVEHRLHRKKMLNTIARLKESSSSSSSRTGGGAPRRTPNSGSPSASATP